MSTAWVVKVTDHSYWNDIRDWNALYDRGVKVVILRASSGGTYLDPKFPVSYPLAKAAGLKVLAYHVNNPLLSALANLANFQTAIAGYRLDGYPVLDCEVTNGVAYSTIRTRLKELFDRTKAVYGKAICYTAAWWWNPVMGVTGWAREVPLMVANYFTSLGGDLWPAPTTYASVVPTEWIGVEPYCWQFSEKGLFPEVSPGNMDKSVGYPLFVADLFDDAPPPPSADTECLTMKTLQNMNVRGGPSTAYPIIGSAPAGAEYEVFGVGGSDSWILTDAGWIAVRTGGKTYCEKV